MAPTLSQGVMLWECLPWDSLLRSSCPRLQAQRIVTQKMQRAFRSRFRARDENGRVLPELTDKQRDMKGWFQGPGKVFEQPAEDSTNYLNAHDLRTGELLRSSRQSLARLKAYEEDENISDAERAKRVEERRRNTSDVTNLPRERAQDLRPFPLNQHFFSERVLSEELRNIIFKRVQELNGDVSAVSAAYGIDMRRVAAVVRLKAIEERWKTEGRKLVKPYNDAVLSMLPQTHPPRNGIPQMHEGINDLPVHAATRGQLFYSTSESRHFTREDAAKAFAPDLLPADKRINHPKLIEIEKWASQGLDVEERRTRIRAMQEEELKRIAAAEARRQMEEAAVTRIVPGRRWDFRFRNISVETVGKDGRSEKGVGVRYGAPHNDRKRGQYKLPTSVE